MVIGDCQRYLPADRRLSLRTRDSIVGVDVKGSPLECQNWDDVELRGLWTNFDTCRASYVLLGTCLAALCEQCGGVGALCGSAFVPSVKHCIVLAIYSGYTFPGINHTSG